VSNDRTTGSPADPSRGTLSPSSPSPAPSAVEDPADPKQQEIRLALRVVVLLSQTLPLEPGGIAPPGSTQQGIASSLRVTQGAVSKVLQGLVAAEVVRHARHHVAGRTRRMRAYSLTARGLDLARRYRERVPNS
jgi:hypothetical protein